MIARFEDHIYPLKSITHTRKTARALLVDEQDNFLFLHIKGADEFGIRNHYESIGGGLEEDESPTNAILREVEEEAGFSKAEILVDLGVIEDTYHLIGRRTLSHFFVVRVNRNDQGMAHPTKEEESLFGGLVWMRKDEVETIMSSDLYCGTIGELVHRRDLCAFRFYQDYLKNIQK